MVWRWIQGRMEKFPATDQNQAFMVLRASPQRTLPTVFTVGEDGAAIALTEDLHGTTETSATFNSPPLAEPGNFAVLNLEVWAFD